MVGILTNRELCNQGILSHYRDAVVDHICVTLSAKYPDDWQERVRKPFKNEWATIREHAESPINQGVSAERTLKDPEDLLDVRHFRNLFEAHFDLFFPGLEDTPEVDRKGLRTNILHWAGTIKMVRDQLAHPSGVDITPEDAAYALLAVERILQRINKDAAQKVNDLWQTVVGPNKTIQPTVVGPNAPPLQLLPRPYFPKWEEMVTVDKFVGREDELKGLRDWLGGPDLYHCRVLVGDGGKGKSAIAYEFASEVSRNRPEGLAIVIWLSAKKVQFQGGADEDKDSDFWDLDSAVNGILKAYQKIGGPNGYEAMEPMAKSAECLEWLETYPALIVLDDFDSLEKRGGMGETLRETRNFFDKELLRKDTKSRVLLTSRVRIPGLEDKFEQAVAGFSREDGEQFIQDVIGKFKLEKNWFPPRVRAEILQVCDGSPLYIEELLRQCKTLKDGFYGKEEVPKVINDWAEAGGERARRYALHEELKTLTREAKNTLLACALFDGPIPRDRLESILKFDDEQLKKVFGELRRLFLIEASQDDEGQITMNSNTKELVINVEREEEPDTVKRLNTLIHASYGGDNQDNQWDFKHRREVLLYTGPAYEAYKGGDYDKAINLLNKAIALCEVDPEADDGRLGDLYGRLALYYKAVGDAMSARGYYKQAAFYRCPVLDTYKHWFDMEKERKEWTAAVDAAERGLKILEQTGASPEDLAALHRMAAEAWAGKTRDSDRRGNKAAASEGRKANQWHRSREAEYRREAKVLEARARRDRLNS